jgi:hypothetical protein
MSISSAFSISPLPKNRMEGPLARMQLSGLSLPHYSWVGSTHRVCSRRMKSCMHRKEILYLDPSEGNFGGGSSEQSDHDFPF